MEDGFYDPDTREKLQPTSESGIGSILTWDKISKCAQETIDGFNPQTDGILLKRPIIKEENSYDESFSFETDFGDLVIRLQQNIFP